MNPKVDHRIDTRTAVDVLTDLHSYAASANPDPLLIQVQLEVALEKLGSGAKAEDPKLVVQEPQP